MPGFCVLMAEFIFQLQPAIYKKSSIAVTLKGPEWTVITLLCLAGAVHMSVYFMYLFFQGLSVRGVESVRVPSRIMNSVYFGCMLSVLAVSCGFFGKSDDMLAAWRGHDPGRQHR